MKQKLKFILLLLFAGSMLFLQSCEKDLYEEPIYKEHSLLIQRKNFADIQKRPQLLNKIENVCKKKVNAQGKMIYDSIKQIYIDLDDVMYIKDSVNTETYTFKILRDGEEKIENLVVSVKSNGETESYLIKYFQEILSTYATNQESIKEELKQYSEVYLVDDNLYQNLQKINYDDCTEVVQVQINVPGVRCHSGQHDATDGELCNYWGTSWEATLGGTEFAYVTLHYDCGGGGGGGFSTGPHGVGGGGGFGDTPPDPCDKLKKILASPTQLPTNVSGAISIKQAIINLQNQVDNATQEQGYSMAYNSTTGQMYAYPASTGYQDNMVVYDPQSNVFGGVHFHFDALQPMFSHDDIPVLYNFMIRFTEPNTSPTIYPMPMHLLVTTQGTYAIVSDENSPFTGYISEIYNDIKKKKKFRRNIEKEYNKFYNPFTNTWNTNSDDYEKSFLKFVEIENSANGGNGFGNLGVSLYKLNSTGTNWQQLALIPSGNDYIVQPINCN